MNNYLSENSSPAGPTMNGGAGLSNLTANHIAPDYVEAMGLSYDPFNESGQLDFFTDAGRQEICDQLVHLTEFSSSVVVVSGEEGSGKTLLFSRLPQLFGDALNLCRVEADVLSSADQVFGVVADALQARVSTDSNIGELLAGIRHQLTRGLEVPLLVAIDDAHLLDDAILSALLSLMQSPAHDQELPLQIVLLGDESLIARLDGFSMVDVLMHDLVLQPLSREECSDYLMFCLRGAGWTEALPFDDAEMDRLVALSQGIPGRLHLPAQELLLDRVTVDLEEMDRSSGLPVAHMFSLVLLMGVLLMAFFYKDSWWASSDPSTDIVVSKSSEAESAVSMKAEVVEPVADQMLEEAESSELLDPADDESSSVASVAEVESEGELPGVVELEMPVGMPQQDYISATPESVTSEPIAADLSQLPAPAAYQAQIVVEKPAIAQASSVTESALTASLSADELALMQLQADHYVLQVMAAGSKTAVERFIHTQKNRSALRLFTTERQGKPWYVVVTGDYVSSQAARRGVADLPLPQKKAGPWPRAALDVQAKIKDFRRI